MVKVKLKSIIASSFYESHKDIKNELHTHYWFKGGRGSTKSSFISIEIVLGMMRDAQEGIISNALILRRVKVYFIRISKRPNKMGHRYFRC